MDWKPITQLRSVIRHMGSHNVTCYPTQVNVPRLNPSHAGQYSIYLPRRDGRLSWLFHPPCTRMRVWYTGCTIVGWKRSSDEAASEAGTFTGHDSQQQRLVSIRSVNIWQRYQQEVTGLFFLLAFDNQFISWCSSVYISRGSAATPFRCGENFNDRFVANYLPRSSVILKIGRYRAKIWTRFWCHIFWFTV